ncbi:MAG: OmpA family protein [Salibacteraceae bacterium]
MMKLSTSFSLAVCLLLLSPVWGQTSKLKFGNPVKLSSEINSTAEENMPHVSADGNTLYFVRTFHPNNIGGEESGQDIWYSNRDGNGWTAPQNNMGNLNNPENNAVTGTSLDGNILYLLYSYGTNRNLNRGLAFSYQEEGGSWKRPKRLKIPSISKREFHQGYYVNRSGDVIIISMTGPNTVGQEDLYVSLKNEKGKWGEPIHLGNMVNTTGFEISPFLDDNGQRLYFSSNGHVGKGDADIFYVERLDDTWTNWSAPINLTEVNSKDFDGYFFIGTNDKAYFSSDRAGELSDLFEVDIIQPAALATTDISGVFEYANLPQAGQTLYLLDENDQVIQTVRTDQYGNFSFSQLDPDKNYLIRIDDETMQDAQLFMVNQDGEKVAILDADSEGLFAFNSLNREKVESLPPMVVPTDDSELGGTFKYNSLSQSNVALELLDENDQVIQTVETDENGNFVFTKLDPETKYLIRVAEKDARFKDKAEIVFVDDNGRETISPQLQSEGTFAFQTLRPDAKTLAAIDEKDPDVPIPTPPNPNPVTEKPVDKPAPDKPIEKPIAQTPKQTEPAVENPKPAEPEKPAPPTYPASDATAVILFEFNSYNLTRATRFQLYQLLDTLKANPELKILIEGHADNVGTEQVNARFSQVRAKTAKDYFISRGIDKSRITTKHYGFSRPAATNDSPQGRSQNRRVEVRIY